MYLVGNWKMEGSRAFVTSHLACVMAEMERLHLADYHTVIHCPPYPLIDAAARIVAHTRMKIGAQDCHHLERGAYTGEVSSLMLKDAGCDYVILGHSERRLQFLENDALVAEKVCAALRARLIPIICVGESYAERATGRYLPILHDQLAAVLKHVGQMHSLIVAYEPIWAIGTGHTPTTADIREVSESIHHHLESHGIAAPSVLYGGSVKAENCADIFAIPSLNGVLVGAASIDAGQWTSIMKAATRHMKE
jgi:triosephosphate isomerase (TIM)